MRYLLRPDLELTGITYVDDVGRYADFHAMRHSFIDVEQVGIYGHSGGGFMTAAALMQKKFRPATHLKNSRPGAP